MTDSMRYLIVIAALASACGSEPWSDRNVAIARDAANAESDRMDWCSRTVANGDFDDADRHEAVAGIIRVGQREVVALVASSYRHPTWSGPVLMSTTGVGSSIYRRWYLEDLYGCGRLDFETRNGIVVLFTE